MEPLFEGCERRSTGERIFKIVFGCCFIMVTELEQNL